jgi:phage-related protein
VPANIVIRIGASATQAVSEIGKVNSALGDQQTIAQKAHAGITKAAVPAALALAAVGAAAIDATKAALEDQAAQEKLASQLGRVTDATKPQIDAVDAYITKMSFATGVADDELRPALGKLATATGSITSAQKELQIALDVSAQTGKSLDSVSTALAKGYTGQTSSLNRLVPGLDQAVIKTKDMTKVNKELADLTGGAAADAASTAAGQYQIFTVRMQELKEGIGAGLIPVVEAFMPLLQKSTEFVAKHTTAVVVVVGAIATLAAGILAANAALKAYAVYQAIFVTETGGMTIAQRALNLALASNPIGLVIVAVAALAAGLVIAYQKSATFRAICAAALDAVEVAARAVVSAFQALLGAAQSAFNWVTAHWKVALFAFGPLGAAISLIASNFDAIKNAAEAAFGAITSGVGAAISAIRSAISWVDSLLDKISRIHVPHIPGLGSIGLSAPGTPAAASRAPGTTSTTSAGGVTVNVYGAVDPEGTARAIRRVIRQHERRLGIAW